MTRPSRPTRSRFAKVEIAVGGCDIAPAQSRMQVVLPHEASQLLVVDDDALLTQRCLHEAVAIGTSVPPALMLSPS